MKYIIITEDGVTYKYKIITEDDKTACDQGYIAIIDVEEMKEYCKNGWHDLTIWSEY